MAEFSLNRIIKGVFNDTHPAYQPEGTINFSINGELIYNDEGYYVWKPMNGNELYFQVNGDRESYLMGWTMIRDTLIIILYDYEDSEVKIYTVEMHTNPLSGTPSATEIYAASAGTWGYTTGRAIKSIFGYYENAGKQWIVFSDDYNPPRIMNIADANLSTKSIASMNFSPELDPPEINLSSIGNGILKSGTYFICARYKNNDGFVSDWTYLSGPFNMSSITGTVTDGFDEYQEAQGDGYNKNTGNSLVLSITDIDTNYDILEMGYLHYDRYGSLNEGYVYERIAISTSSDTSTLSGSLKYDSINISNIINQYIAIIKSKEVQNIENVCCPANITEVPELDIGDDLACDISDISYEFPMDSTGLPDADSLSKHRALSGLRGTDNEVISVTGLSSPSITGDQFRCAVGELEEGDIVKFTNNYNDGLVTPWSDVCQKYWEVVDARVSTSPAYTYFALKVPHKNDGLLYTYYFGNAGIGNFGSTADITLKCMKMPVNIIPGVWYRCDTNISYWDGTETSANVPSLHSQGDVFRIKGGGLPSGPEHGGILHTGTITPILHIRKYKNYSGDDEYADYEMTEGYLNYKGIEMNRYLKGYARKQKIRLAFIGIDKYGKRKYARHLVDNTTGGDYVMPDHDDMPLVNESLYNFDVYSASGKEGEIFPFKNGYAAGIQIDNLDISDIIDDISAFMIVRAPIIPRYSAHGIIEKTKENTAGLAEGNRVDSYYGVLDDERWLNNYVFLSPDHLLNKSGFEVLPSNSIENLHYFIPDSKDSIFKTPYDTYFEGIGIFDVSSWSDTASFYSVYQKFYYGDTEPANSNGVLFKTNDIIASSNLEVGSGEIYPDPRNPGNKFFNQANNFPDADTQMFGSEGLYIVTNDSETLSNPVGKYNLAKNDPQMLYTGIVKNDSIDYGSIEQTGYVEVGHYQVVDNTFKTAILTGGNYIIDGLQIFGGDTILGMFDITRLYYDAYNQVYTSHYNHSVIFPCESVVNFELRNGNHFAKDRSYHDIDNTNGIKIDNDPNVGHGRSKIEEFYYNTGYSVHESGALYPNLPDGYTDQNEFDTRMRWSNKKITNETINSFRQFASLNYIDFPTINDEIINIRGKKNRMFCWQKNGFSYSPYNERELIQNTLGQPVQIGLGGEFQRTDEILRKIGNSHQAGLVETENGFIWCDLLRKAIINFDISKGLIEESFVKGFTDFLKIAALRTMEYDYDNALFGEQGIIGGYDPVKKTAYLTFISDPTSRIYTFMINIVHNVFVGTTEMDANAYINIGNQLLFYKKGLELVDLYKESSSNICQFFGTNETAYLDIIINKDPEILKVFDMIEYESSENFFDTITFINEEDSVRDDILNTTTGVLKETNYEYMNGVWRGNVPLETGSNNLLKRIGNKGYLKIRLRVDEDRTDKDVYLRSIKTKYRKLY